MSEASLFDSGKARMDDPKRHVAGAPRAKALALGALAMLATALPGNAAAERRAQRATPLGSEARLWPRFTDSAIRGITIGPIENALHSQKGYGTRTSTNALDTARRWGANWVSLTPFGRTWDLAPNGVELTFEAELKESIRNIKQTVQAAHANGLRVLLVPHLWVETGEWRALIHFDDREAAERFEASYRRFLLLWASVAEEAKVDLFSVGVEWRSWVTTTRAPSFSTLIADVRKAYSGPITYAANWDDAVDTVIWGELDVIGINAFYPLADRNDAGIARLISGGETLAAEVEQLAASWQKPILFTEMGYTTRPNPAIRPWEWPDHMTDVEVDERAQAEAYLSLLSAFVDKPWFMGFFAWRVYADPFDSSQEAPWGFSPAHKQAELVLRDCYAHPFAYDIDRGGANRAFSHDGALRIGNY